MKCIYCGSENHIVADTRVKTYSVRRRRKCVDCGKAWKTIEAYEPNTRIIKGNWKKPIEERA